MGRSVNYLYFGAMFLFLSLLVASSIFTKVDLGGSHIFFFLYAIGQITLEMMAFVLLAILMERYWERRGLLIFVGFTFVVLVLHVLDFMMNRVLDLSLIEAFNVFVVQENWSNFLYLLDASGIPLWGWLLFFSSLSTLPFIGILLYKLTEQITQKHPLPIRKNIIVQGCFCIPCALFLWDYSASNAIHPDAYTAMTQSLPWKTTFLQPDSVSWPIHSLYQPQSQTQIASWIDQNKVKPAHRPNIYLFVVESLREDMIDSETAPHLNQFKNEYGPSIHAVSNGNGTHISWFSLFFSQFPHYWQTFQKNWHSGSPALHLLKSLGYQIHVYSSAELGYYGMEKLLFGKEDELLSNKHSFHHTSPHSAADSDRAALIKLQTDLQTDPKLQRGQLFIIFWDCTHFDYSWPKNWTPKFTPFAKQFAYFKTIQSPATIVKIKNRYRNAVHYMDSLFGQFLEHVPNKEEAIIAFTGDHGEEFFEHGHLFHNSHLSKEQTHIPLYLKLGSSQSFAARPLISQMDLFPTLVDYLANLHPPFLEGNSLLQTPKWPYAVTARFNAGCTPYQFALHNGKHKLIAQFTNRSHIFDPGKLQILSLQTKDDETVLECTNQIESWVQSEFGNGLNRLFD